MYKKGENLNDLVCWYLVSKSDIFSHYRTDGIVTGWGGMCKRLLEDVFDSAVKDNDEQSQKLLQDFYNENNFDDIYDLDNPQEVADLFMKEIDFINYNTPFDDYIRNLINDDSLIKKPWQH